jgi:archaellum component FlaC
MSDEVEVPEAGSSVESEEVQEVQTEVADQEVEDNGEQAEPIEMSREDFEKLQSQLVHSQKTIGKQANDVGTAKKTIEELEAKVKELNATKERMQEDGLPDTFEAIETHTALTDTQRKLEEANKTFLETQNKTILTQMDPVYDKRVDKMAELMLQDGYPVHEVAAFKSNPYFVDQGIAIAYLNRAKEADRYDETLELLKRLDPKGVAAKIQAAAKGGASVTAATGGGSSGEVEVTSQRIRSATKKQLSHYNKTGEWINP